MKIIRMKFGNRVKGKTKTRCYLRGTIVNITDERKEKIRITFHAMNIHGEMLWKVNFKISGLGPYGKFKFKKR